MATPTHQRPHREATSPAANVEHNTLDEQSAECGQSHVANAPQDDRERCISVAAYLRAELGDWLEEEKEEDSGGFDLN